MNKKNIDTIFINQMQFYGYHGVLESEAKLGQPFYVSLRLHTNTLKAGLSDNLEHSSNYADIFNTVREIVETQRFKLLEALAEHIAAIVLKDYPLIDALLVTLDKPHAPIAGIFKSVGVEIYRER